jgi:sulfatase modifying factor 1
MCIVNNSKTITDNVPGSQDAPYVKADATGFRLPSDAEWNCAARYTGPMNPGWVKSKNGIYWTEGCYASGATADYNDAEATKAVGWYSANSDSGLHKVKNKKANQLLLYDMSGNIWEWCFDWQIVGTCRRVRDGCYLHNASFMQIAKTGSHEPDGKFNYVGFRFARSIP